ncbi:MAG: hypothetical protein K0Q74_589, partial [Gammaproteobacteria bacterium]|nr:hypothetical protein [Gammaproteobacteria bacterium]
MEVNKTLRWLELCGSQELAQEEFISDDNQLAEDESATLLQALEKNTTIRQIFWNGLGVSGRVSHILKRNREIECAREVLKNVLGLPDFVGGLVSSYLSKASLVDGKPSFELTSDLDSAAVIRKSAQPSVLSAKKSDMGLGV